MMFGRDVLREEEEVGGGTGGAYYDSLLNLADKEDLNKWWKATDTAIPKFLMYAVFLATEGDTEVVSFIESKRPDLKEMSGKTCCFVYFRDRDVAIKDLKAS
jgi:hypothetical protein